jgi:two-component system sensor histidine kinase HydH
LGVWAVRLHFSNRRLRDQVEQLNSIYGKLQANFEGMKRAERLSSLGQLSAGLAHEIRNPLASIAGAASILGKIQGLDEKSSRCVDIIAKETSRLNDLLTNFLNFARPRSPQFRYVTASSILDHAMELAAHAKQSAGLNIVREIDGELPEIFCDPEQVGQVLLNLLINALEASPAGSTIHLRAALGDAALIFEVSDEGPGIPPSDVDRLFDPFFTTKEHGTGLGLPVAHQIIQQLGGTLQVRHNWTRGMTFSIHLPLETAPQ